jgi:hypothetical protein
MSLSKDRVSKDKAHLIPNVHFYLSSWLLSDYFAIDAFWQELTFKKIFILYANPS